MFAISEENCTFAVPEPDKPLNDAQNVRDH
jgi:hypothetical protein